MKLKNRAKIRIKSYNQERILNNITKKINIYNYIKEEKNISSFEVDLKNQKYVIQNLKSNNIEIVSIKHEGIKNKVLKIFSNIGLIIGVIISILIYILQYQFIWNIEILGDKNIDDKEMLNFINSNIQSRFKSKIDLDKLEIQIKDNFDNISSVSVAIIGQSLVVNLNVSSIPNEMLGNYPAIVSQYDCLVKEINLIQGTLNVKVGDIVKKGDVLVYPYVIDSQGGKRDIEPKANIFAEVWFSSSIKHYDYFIEIKKTGKSIVNSDIQLFGLNIYQNYKENSFENYEVETKTISLTNNLILPFKLKKTIYYETEVIEHYEPFEAVKEKIIDQARQKTLIFLSENEIISKENFTIKEEVGFYTVNYYITTYKDVAYI